MRSRDESGKIQYGYCYGRTYEEAKEKREYQLHMLSKPKELKLLIWEQEVMVLMSMKSQRI